MRQHKHSILRAYIALVRGEHYTLSEIGDSIEFIDPNTGELISSYPTIQLNWTEDEELIKSVCKAWGITEVEFSKRLIFWKPSFVENLVYSSELRKKFGAGALRVMPEFDNEGNFILPKQRGFYVPKRNGNLIISLEFFEMSSLTKKMVAKI